MISCDRALELISLALDGPLEEADRKELEEHLAQCASCRQLRDDLAELHRALPELEAGPPEDLAQAVRARLRPALWKRPAFRVLTAAACVLLCVCLLRPVPPAMNTSVAPSGEVQSRSDGAAPAMSEPASSAPADAAGGQQYQTSYASVQDAANAEAEISPAEAAPKESQLFSLNPRAKGRPPAGGRTVLE